jgi:hypothetical protein
VEGINQVIKSTSTFLLIYFYIQDNEQGMLKEVLSACPAHCPGCIQKLNYAVNKQTELWFKT